MDFQHFWRLIWHVFSGPEEDFVNSLWITCPLREGVYSLTIKEPIMAKDARTGAGKTRAPAGLSGPSSKGNGQGAEGSSKTTPNAPETVPNLNLSRFWKKSGSPFDATRAALQSAKNMAT